MASSLAHITVAPATPEEQIICGAYSAYDFLNSPEGREVLQKDQTEEVVDYYELERFLINENINLYEVPNPEIFYVIIYLILSYCNKTNEADLSQDKINQYKKYLKFAIWKSRQTAEFQKPSEREPHPLILKLDLESLLAKDPKTPQFRPLPNLINIKDTTALLGSYNDITNTIKINTTSHEPGTPEYENTVRHEFLHAAQTRFAIFNFLKEAAAENNTNNPEAYEQCRNLVELIQHATQRKITRENLERLTLYKHNPGNGTKALSQFITHFQGNPEVILDLLRTTTNHTLQQQTSHGRCIPSVAANTIMYKHVLPNIEHFVPYSLGQIANYYTQITGYEAPPEIFAQIEEVRELFSENITGFKQALYTPSAPNKENTWQEKILPKTTPPVPTLRKSIAERLNSLLPKDQ